MSLPATATGQWFTASLIRALQEIAPDFPLHLGPLTSAPPAIPAVVLEPVTHTWQPVLGQRVSASASQRGGLLTITHRLLLLSSPTTGDLFPVEYLARVRAPLTAGPIPWIAETTPGDPQVVGTLQLQWDDVQATLPAPNTAWMQSLQLAVAECRIAVSGLLEWPEGASP